VGRAGESGEAGGDVADDDVVSTKAVVPHRGKSKRRKSTVRVVDLTVLAYER